VPHLQFLEGVGLDLTLATPRRRPLFLRPIEQIDPSKPNPQPKSQF
jgi:hypothetical protein